ncbi:MAG: RNA polymerase sigma factor [Rhodocyclaceae bacterium]|nr:RNA polymerase sigma factor [Rhodocyclaceae bacterium]
MASRSELSTFLASVERRAYKQVLFAVRDEEAALDIVQDSMMRLTEKYALRPAEELPLLFQRILQNAIRDYFRRAKVREGQFVPLAEFEDPEEPSDPLEMLPVAAENESFANPETQLSQHQTLALIEEALKNLPPRQREAFLLRYWEGLDIAETAKVMGCSEGSVKTHCSRATQTLAAFLSAHGIRL